MWCRALAAVHVGGVPVCGGVASAIPSWIMDDVVRADPRLKDKDERVLRIYTQLLPPRTRICPIRQAAHSGFGTRQAYLNFNW